MDDQRTNRAGGRMNWMFVRRRFRFSLISLLVIMSLVAVCLSSYLIGRRAGNEEGYQNGYLHGKEFTDSAWKARMYDEYLPEINDHISHTVKAEDETVRLRRELRKAQSKK